MRSSVWWLSVAAGLVLRSERSAECNCACCATLAPEEGSPLRCGVPFADRDHPAAYFVTCENQCTFDGNFVLSSAYGNVFDLERFCFSACEPSISKAEKAGGACEPIQQDLTIHRTYGNGTAYSDAFKDLELDANDTNVVPVGNALGNGNAPVLRGPETASELYGNTGTYACGRFPARDVCSDKGPMQCVVRRDKYRGETCDDVCGAQKMDCMMAFGGDICPMNSSHVMQLDDPPEWGTVNNEDATYNEETGKFEVVQNETNQSNPIITKAEMGGFSYPGMTSACSSRVIELREPEAMWPPEPVQWCHCALPT